MLHSKLNNFVFKKETKLETNQLEMNKELKDSHLDHCLHFISIVPKSADKYIFGNPFLFQKEVLVK